MSEHSHVVPLTFLPGVKPSKATLTHVHATRPEEPHKHRLTVGITTQTANTIGGKR